MYQYPLFLSLLFLLEGRHRTRYDRKAVQHAYGTFVTKRRKRRSTKLFEKSVAATITVALAGEKSNRQGAGQLHCSVQG